MMTSSVRGVGAALLLVLGAPGARAQGTPPTYSVEFLGPGLSIADMNEAGVVVGSMIAGPATRAWIAGPGSPQSLLPLPPGRQSSGANSINDLGEIVGRVSSQASPEFGGVATLWRPLPGGGYATVELGMLPGHITSNATAINNVGDIVGHSFNGMYRYPVRFTAPGVVDLSATGVFDPQAVNDARVMVDVTGKRLDLVTMAVEDLGIPTNLPSSYIATNTHVINLSGQVAGVAILATSTHCDRQAARYTDGIGWEILSVCGSSNGAYDLNDLGDVVMRLNVAPYVRLEGAGTFLIEGLIENTVGHWYVINGFGLAINNGRQMAVPAHNPTTGESGAVLLTPEDEVGVLACAGDGSGAACPCGNASASGSGQGCSHSAGGGAVLTGHGSASVSADDLVLRLQQAPPSQPAMFIQGMPAPGAPFGDGILCTGSPVIRLEPFVTSAAGTGATNGALAAKGGAQPGMVLHYQAWFRDPAGPCSAGSNLSSGLRVTWR